MEEIIITIGITAYREGSLLKEAWESVLKQINQDWMAVIVLDGGFDEITENIFNNINHPRLTKFKFQKNSGPYTTRTKAIELTQTKWFLYLDGDDLLPTDTIEAFYKTINNQYSFWGGLVKLVFPDGSTKIHNCIDFNTNAMVYNNFCPAIVAFKKSAFYNIGGYSQQLIRGKADFDLLLSIYESDYKFLIIEQVIYEYIQRNNSVSKSYNGDYGFRNLVISKRHPKFFHDSTVRNYFLLTALESSFLYHYNKKHYKLAHIYKRRVQINVKLNGYKKFVYRLPSELTYQILIFRNFYRKNVSQFIKKVSFPKKINFFSRFSIL